MQNNEQRRNIPVEEQIAINIDPSDNRDFEKEIKEAALEIWRQQNNEHHLRTTTN